jgi:hypothetical protein
VRDKSQCAPHEARGLSQPVVRVMHPAACVCAYCPWSSQCAPGVDDAGCRMSCPDGQDIRQPYGSPRQSVAPSQSPGQLPLLRLSGEQGQARGLGQCSQVHGFSSAAASLRTPGQARGLPRPQAPQPRVGAVPAWCRRGGPLEPGPRAALGRREESESQADGGWSGSGGGEGRGEQSLRVRHGQVSLPPD